LADSRRIEDVLGALVRLVLNLRILVILATVLWMPYAMGSLQLVSLALVLMALATLVPLLAWERVGPLILRRPSVLAADLVLSVGVLLVTGPESPFFHFTLGTALLAGFLYGAPGAAVLGGLLVSGYLGVVALRVSADVLEVTFQAVAGMPALYLVCAGGGAAVRRLLLRQHEVESALVQRTEEAIIADERARLAREMHDSLAKTLHGIALSAAVLPSWVDRDPARAAESARQVATAAERAAGEARELIGDLRSDRLDQPLEVAVTRVVEEWSRGTRVWAELDVAALSPVAPEVRYELFCILKEALRNVERHAEASAVRVQLLRADAEVVLVVHDDGRGFPVAASADLAAAGHYGVVGMEERAARVGGRCLVGLGPGGGTRVTASVPPDGQPAPTAHGRPADWLRADQPPREGVR
jgi:signal transduction histidine kinase